MYKKKFYRKKKKYNKKRAVLPYGKIGKYAGYALSAYRMAKYLKSVINVEYKYKDTVAGVTNITQTPAITLLSLINQGDTSTSRDGDSVKLVKMDLTVTLDKNVGSTAVNHIKVALIKKNPTNGVAPTNTDIYDTSTGSMALVRRNLAYTDSIKVVRNWDVALVQGEKESKTIKLSLNMNDHVKFKGTAQTVADIMTSSYWLYVVTDQSATFPTYTFSCRLRFIDN